MRNSEVANAFACGLEGRAGNFFSTGDKAFSYGTIIAQRVNGTIYLNGTYYSNTTSRHLNLIKRSFYYGQQTVTLREVPMGTDDLVYYLKHLK